MAIVYEDRVIDNKDPNEARRENLRLARQAQIDNKGFIGSRPGTNQSLTHQARIFAKAFLDSPQYRESLARRILQDTLPPGIEQMLWHYTYGKPKENVQITLGNAAELREMTDEELEERASAVLEQIRHTRQLKKLADAEAAEEKRNTIDVELVK